MTLTLPFTEISKTDTATAGGKGASLGEMTQAGIPVPPGFVILTNAFEIFLQKTSIAEKIQTHLSTITHTDLDAMTSTSAAIQKLILDATIPAEIEGAIQQSFQTLNAPYVAVRSSATAEDGSAASWAGELESYLNTDHDSLLTNIKKCWASLFSPRALFYRFEKGFSASTVSVAVVVQKMVESEVSGIAFSVHPVTEDINQILIEAGYGLGEAIVSGVVTPDSVTVSKSDLSIHDLYIADQEKKIIRSDSGGNQWVAVLPSLHEVQKLTSAQILELAQLVLMIERHYHFPCDIEWALEHNTFYIVQSRPITTLK